jgi:hypothetical protein
VSLTFYIIIIIIIILQKLQQSTVGSLSINAESRLECQFETSFLAG